MPDYQFIDVHVHVISWEMLKPAVAGVIKASRPDIDRLYELSANPHKLVEYMDRCNVERLGLVNCPSPEVTGYDEAINDFSAGFAASHPNRFIPFGGIDPLRTTNMVATVDHLLGDLGIKAVKLHPPHQFFNVNDYLFKREFEALTVVYQKCIEYDVPVMVHTGTSVFQGARNRFADPMPIDDVAVDFPRLKIILAHAGRPLYTDTALFLVRRHPNVYLDISGIPPKSLRQNFPWLERVAGKVMFGSDWPDPGVDIAQNIEQFLALGFSDEVNRKILRDNAVKVFNL